MQLAEAGATTQAISDAAASAGLFYPPDPASLRFSTIGGNIAECAGGPRAVKYGVTYDCTPDVEKAVYHGSRTWALTIIPLHGNDNLPVAKVAEIKAGLGHLHG